MKDKNDIVRGYLKKLKNSSLTRMFGATNLRWFECNLQTKHFGYKEGSTDKNFLSYVSIKEITDYNENLTDQEKQYCEWKFGFKVIAKGRTFVLYSQTLNERVKWKKAFDIILNRVLTKPETIKTPSPPKIDYEELERKRKLKEEEMKRKKFLEEKERRERLEREREMERNAKKGFYDDVSKTITNYAINVDHYVKQLKNNDEKIEELKRNNSKENNKEDFILNEEEIDDWNYYGVDGNLMVEETKTVKPNFLVSEFKPNPIKKIVDYQAFKKNLVLENLCDDRYKRQKEIEEEEKRRMEEEIIRKAQEEEEERRLKELELKLKMEQEREKEYKMSLLKGVEKIKVEIDAKRNLVEKYIPNLNPERGTKYSIYENNIGKNPNINFQFEGVDLSKRADPKYLNNELIQPYNIVGDTLGLQKSNYKPNQSSILDTSKIKQQKKNSLDVSNLDISNLDDKIINLNSSEIHKNQKNNTKSPDEKKKPKKNTIAYTFLDIMDEMRDFEHGKIDNSKEVKNNNKKNNKINRESLINQIYNKEEEKPVSKSKEEITNNNKIDYNINRNNQYSDEEKVLSNISNINIPTKEININKTEEKSKLEVNVEKKKVIHSNTVIGKSNDKDVKTKDASPTNIKSSTSLRITNKVIHNSEAMTQKKEKLKKEEESSPKKSKYNDENNLKRFVVDDEDEIRVEENPFNKKRKISVDNNVKKFEY